MKYAPHTRCLAHEITFTVNSVICVGKGIFSKDPGSPVLTENFLSAATSTEMSLSLSNYAQPHVTHKLNFLVESGDFLLLFSLQCLPVNTT